MFWSYFATCPCVQARPDKIAEKHKYGSFLEKPPRLNAFTLCTKELSNISLLSSPKS